MVLYCCTTVVALFYNCSNLGNLLHITEPPRIISPEHAFLHQKVKSKGLKDSSTCKSEVSGTLRGWNKSTTSQNLELLSIVPQNKLSTAWNFGEFFFIVPVRLFKTREYFIVLGQNLKDLSKDFFSKIEISCPYNKPGGGTVWHNRCGRSPWPPPHVGCRVGWRECGCVQLAGEVAETKVHIHSKERETPRHRMASKHLCNFIGSGCD